MFGRYAALAALALAGSNYSAASSLRVVEPRGQGMRRLRFVDHTRYPGHVLREIRSSTERQARECARRRRQAREYADRLLSA